MRNIKRLTTVTSALVVSIALAIALVFGSLVFAMPFARAESDTTEFELTSLSLANTQFSDSGSGTPGEPSSWTKDAVGDANIVAGVVDLTPTAYNTADKKGNKEYKLDQYDEYKTEDLIPVTIFGKPERENTDAKTLLINTPKGAEAIYAYKSADMTFEPNSFYRVSAWVKTGNFKPDTGATIKLTGLGETCSFVNINTVKSLGELNKDNDYGWVQYNIYVRTSASLSKTVNLSLGIGNAVSEDEKPLATARAASGYAFFDTVEAYRISAFDYAFNTGVFTETDRDNVTVGKNGTSMAIDLYDTEFFTADGKEIGSFSDDENNKLWTNAVYDPDEESSVSSGTAAVSVYDSAKCVNIEENKFGFTKNPWAPLGRSEYHNVINNNDDGFGGNGNILLISTYNNSTKSFDKGARGVASPDVTIERFKYYRFGVWVKGDSVTDGAGISIGVKGQANNSDNDNKLKQWYDSLAGDDSATAHYGWKEQVVYIQGSVLSDLTVHFELWLGSPESQSSGIAMFDNVTFREVSYSEYTEMSGADGGNVLSLDKAATDTGVTNGNFMSVGDYEKFEYPLPVASFTQSTPDAVNNKGFSKAKVDTENAVYGLIPTDTATFMQIKKSGVIPGVSNPATFVNAPLYNALILSSVTKTAFCYTSPNITVPTDSAYKMTVELAVDGVSDNGYGASLVLKTSEGAVLSTIENITDTHKEFVAYTFYVDAPLSEKTLNVEVWLGMNDRKDNSSKLSDGNVYVKSVSAAKWEAASEDSTVDAEFAALLDEYKQLTTNKALLKTLKFGMYSFKAPSLDYYDAYSYMNGNGLGTLYGWSSTTANSNVKSGIFDSDSTTPYDGFDKKDLSGNMLYIYNTAPGYTKYSYDNTLSLVANTYYRLDVTVKVLIDEASKNNENAIGANIALKGTVEDVFENIKDTSTLQSKNHEETRDYETFKTYTFFIATGENGGEIGLDISLGGDSRTKYIQGKLIVGDVKLTAINNTAFDDAADDLDETDQKAVRLSDEKKDDSSDNTESTRGDIAWWIIPTIIFSACMLAAIILIVVMRIREKVKSKKKTTYTTEYDRNATLKDIERLQAQRDELNADTPDDSNADVMPEDDFDEPQAQTDAQSDADTPAADDGASPAPEQEPAAQDDNLDD